MSEQTKAAINYFSELRRRFEDKPDESLWGKEHKRTTRDMIDIALEALCRSDGWIPTSERIPKDREYVLIYEQSHLGSSIQVACHEPGIQTTWKAPGGPMGWKDKDVIYWQPLPRPPKGDK